MKIAIIEDEQLHIEVLSGYLQNWSRKKQIPLQLMAFQSAESFLFQWEEEKDFAALFVDIQMKHMNGMEMAKKIRQEDGEIAMIFTTGITDYLAEGYEVEALHYLLKPLNEKKVRQCMDKVYARRQSEAFMILHGPENVIRVSFGSINYIEAQGHGCRLELVRSARSLSEKGHGDAENTQILELTESLSEVAALLPPTEFFRCHRSYLCRIAAIHHIDKTEVYFDSGSHIPVSRRMYSELNQAFIRYFRKEIG